MKTFYHVTLSKNLPKILKQGLKPQKVKRGKGYTHTAPGVYLFVTLDEAEDGICNWLGDELGDQNLAILEVSLAPNTFQPDPELNLSAVVTFQSISPQQIKVLHNEEDLASSYP